MLQPGATQLASLQPSTYTIIIHFKPISWMGLKESVSHWIPSEPHTSTITVFVELNLERKRVTFGEICSSDPMSYSRCVLMTFLQLFTPQTLWSPLDSIGRERYCKPTGARCSFPPLLRSWFTTHFMHMLGISPPLKPNLNASPCNLQNFY